MGSLRRASRHSTQESGRAGAMLRSNLLRSDACGLSMAEKRYNVLFLCTGNSARSIMAEAILNRKGAPTFTAYSAGSHPAGTVRPEALRQIQTARLSTAALRSKGWEEFARTD